MKIYSLMITESVSKAMLQNTFVTTKYSTPSQVVREAIGKLDGVGPVDNRPSTDKLHHFVQKKEEKKVTCDMRHVTCDT